MDAFMTRKLCCIMTAFVCCADKFAKIARLIQGGEGLLVLVLKPVPLGILNTGATLDHVDDVGCLHILTLIGVGAIVDLAVEDDDVTLLHGDGLVALARGVGRQAALSAALRRGIESLEAGRLSTALLVAEIGVVADEATTDILVLGALTDPEAAAGFILVIESEVDTNDGLLGLCEEERGILVAHDLTTELRGLEAVHGLGDNRVAQAGRSPSGLHLGGHGEQVEGSVLGVEGMADLVDEVLLGEVLLGLAITQSTLLKEKRNVLSAVDEIVTGCGLVATVGGENGILGFDGVPLLDELLHAALQVVAFARGSESSQDGEAILAEGGQVEAVAHDAGGDCTAEAIDGSINAGAGADKRDESSASWFALLDSFLLAFLDLRRAGGHEIHASWLLFLGLLALSGGLFGVGVEEGEAAAGGHARDEGGASIVDTLEDVVRVDNASILGLLDLLEFLANAVLFRHDENEDEIQN